MEDDELTPDERTYLTGFLAHEPRPRSGARADTWAAIQARTQHERERPRLSYLCRGRLGMRDCVAPGLGLAHAAPRRDEDRGFLGSAHLGRRGRRLTTAWVVGLAAVAAGIVLGWGLGRWEQRGLFEGRDEAGPSEAAYEATSAPPRHMVADRPERPSRPPESSGGRASVKPEVTLSPPPPEPEVAAPRTHRARPQRRSGPASNLTPTELQQLEDARRLAVHGDPERALLLLREHRRRYPGSMLAEERAVAEVQALCRKGDVPAARQRTKQFVRRHPKSHLVDTMRRVCHAESESGRLPDSDQ